MEEDLDGNSSQALVKRRIIDEIAEEKLRGTYLMRKTSEEQIHKEGHKRKEQERSRGRGMQSWAESHKEEKSGIYTLSFYDEAGYAAYRKAQRSGTENEAKPLFTVDIDHKGAGREGLYVQTEFIAVVAALLIWWSANNVKSKLQES
ncbi:Translocon-associated protein subunit delta [Acropora cervicornis]|uniref:Translocon-associated protein subunit delta n=1 Tax=Acropora cervicornis TaxID=6130 RepID=A0AAD9PQZ4_ACRCE|nr:Translocon-associated protein subunit delta [Acropora cervicornis]